jgi:hypothetical protein
MHKAAEHPIELQRVTFVDVPTPLDCPTQHTRSALRSAKPLSMEEAVPMENSSSTTTTDLANSANPRSEVRSTIVPEPASLVVPRQLE